MCADINNRFRQDPRHASVPAVALLGHSGRRICMPTVSPGTRPATSGGHLPIPAFRRRGSSGTRDGSRRWCFARSLADRRWLRRCCAGRVDTSSQGRVRGWLVSDLGLVCPFTVSFWICWKVVAVYADIESRQHFVGRGEVRPDGVACPKWRRSARGIVVLEIVEIIQPSRKLGVRRWQEGYRPERD